jgi:predicted nucleic acid-binding protein
MICVDASVAVKWILPEELSDQARALYRAHLRAREPIVAPTLLLYEVTNIVRQQLRARRVPSLVAAGRLLDDFLAFAIDFHDPPALHKQALAIADAFDLPAAYDAHYLALAEDFDCEFWTNDQRLLRRVGRSLPYVRWLGDYALTAGG